MLYLTKETQILLAIHPVDFRKQIDGLIHLCHKEFQRNPKDGCLYVFINRAKTMIKILGYDNNGYWLALKRLSRGKYVCWPKNLNSLTFIMAHELKHILRGPLALEK